MEFTDSELEAYLDMSLNPARAGELEEQVRQDPEILKRLTQINARRNAGIHTLGEIWRRNQIGVPTREEIVDFLNGFLPLESADYIEFRVKQLKCVFTLALIQDVQSEKSDGEGTSVQRQSKLYEQSKPLLKKRKKS
jgi:hypothetical protein